MLKASLLCFALAAIICVWTLQGTSFRLASKSFLTPVERAAKLHTAFGNTEGLTELLPNLANLSFHLPCNAYYINLESSTWRRRMMEKTFGHIWSGKLHRVEGVNGQNQTMVDNLIGDPELAERVRAGHLAAETQGLNELGVILSHLYAVKEAYHNGDDVALILEDDVGPYLMPYWTLSIGDVVNIINEESPAWDSVQLAWWPKHDHLEDWLDKTLSTPLAGGYFLKARWHWSTAAYLISRRGMVKVLDRFFTGRNAGAHVMPAVGDRLAIDTDVYYKDLVTENHLIVPSMFITHSRDSTVGKPGDERSRYLQLLTQFMTTLSIRALRDKHFSHKEDQ